MPELRRDDQGVVGTEHRIVVIAPQRRPHRGHASDLRNLLGIGHRDQVVAPGDQPLDDDLRGAGEGQRRLTLERVGEEHNRRQ